MFSRLMIAFVGASGITLGMLYGMNEIVEIFRDRDATQYFGITDVMIMPGDPKPRRIPNAGVQPERGGVDYERPDTSLDIERPSVDVGRQTDVPRIRPRLEDGPTED